MMKEFDEIVISSDSLINLGKIETDYMIIENELKNKNPDFDVKERSLLMKRKIFDYESMINFVLSLVEKYGLTYYQVKLINHKTLKEEFYSYQAFFETGSIFLNETTVI